jgi:DNA-binding PadR family transcriptional regulator
MSETNSAGQKARTDGDELTDQKTSGPMLGHGETHIPADDAVILTDGGTVAARIPELPDFQRDILLTLARSEPTHGQGLIDDLGTLRDESINNGRLYPNLDRLVGKGLIEKQIRATDGRTNEYRLTLSGRTALRNHAKRVEVAVEALDFDSNLEHIDD